MLFHMRTGTGGRDLLLLVHASMRLYRMYTVPIDVHREILGCRYVSDSLLMHVLSRS